MEPFRRALALDPGNAEAHHQYGQALMALGRYDEAIRAYENTVALEPGRGMTLMAIGAVREAQGDVQAGLMWLDSAISLAPDLSYTRATRSGARIRAGDPQGALHDAERAISLNPDGVPERATLSHAVRAVGREDEADELLADVWRQMANADPPSSTDALYAARALTAAGRTDDALDLLQRVRPLGGFYWFYLDKADFVNALDSAAVAQLSADAWPDASRPPPVRRR